MPVDRPTFSESWYRVGELRPRVLSTVQIHRQHFRGQAWHVLADPASNQFFRLNEAAYRFVALLDGRRTVADVWKVCNEQLGDDAPTQPEAIQLLGQLYTSNLLAAELPPDAQGLFSRYRKRVTREVQSYLMNIMFARIPLLDPDNFLDHWVGVFGWVFSWLGAAVWLALLSVGLYFLIGKFESLLSQAQNTFQTLTLANNLLPMYIATVVTKVLHEFGHAFACKKFGKQTGSGGEVHVMGIMFLIFTPLPYVDASSSWAFRSKWHRAVVGLAGMYVELAVAAIAAIVWAQTGEASVIHSIAFYVVFIAGVSTVLFNANPLLRYDGYYILSDLLEMPNLWQRSRQYLYYLVKRYAWGVRRPTNPAHTAGECVWLTLYGIASSIYRVVVCLAIMWFFAQRLEGPLFVLGVFLTITSLIAWIFVPIGQFARYLFTSGELMRVRGRAMLTTLLAVGGAIAAIGVIRMTDHGRAEALVVAAREQDIEVRTEGFVSSDPGKGAPSGTRVQAGQPLVVCRNPQLEAERDRLTAALTEAREKLTADMASLDPHEAASVPVDRGNIAAIKDDLDIVQSQLAGLTVIAPLAGDWVSPNRDRMFGVYVTRGQPLGKVIDRSQLILSVWVPQSEAWLIAEAEPVVEFRVRGRPDLNGGRPMTGHIAEVRPAGTNELPSAALGFAGGGDIPVSTSDREGRQATEQLFEVRVAPDGPFPDLQPGEVVVVRFAGRSRPLAMQWWRTILQTVQKKFHI